MGNYILVQTSTDSQESAQKIADSIIQSRLAACCWISTIQSSYWWQDVIEKQQEWTLQFKTRASLYEELEKAIKSMHSYEVPEIVAIPIIQGNQNFLDWIKNETRE